MTKKYKQTAAKRASDAARQNTERRKRSRKMYNKRKQLKRMQEKAAKRGDAGTVKYIDQILKTYGNAFRSKKTGEWEYSKGDYVELVKAHVLVKDAEAKKTGRNVKDSQSLKERGMKAARQSMARGSKTAVKAVNLLTQNEIYNMQRGNYSPLAVQATDENRPDYASDEEFYKAQAKAFYAVTSQAWAGSGVPKELRDQVIMEALGVTTLEEAWDIVMGTEEAQKAIYAAVEQITGNYNEDAGSPVGIDPGWFGAA